MDYRTLIRKLRQIIIKTNMEKNLFTEDTLDTSIFAATVIISVLFSLMGALLANLYNTDTALVANTVTDIINASPSTLNPSQLSSADINSLQEKLNSIYVMVTHCSDQLIEVKTINLDVTWNVHQFFIVNASTTAAQLEHIDQQITDCLTNFINNSVNTINVHLVIGVIDPMNESLFISPLPFLPLRSYFSTNPFNLSLLLENHVDAKLILKFTPDKLNLLSNYISFLINKGNELHAMSIATSDDNLAADSWEGMLGSYQLLRYAEAIFNMFGFREATSNFVTDIAEEV